MKCLSCDVVLSNAEATRKYKSSGTFVDLCNHCFAPVADSIPVIEGKGANNGQEESFEEE